MLVFFSKLLLVAEAPVNPFIYVSGVKSSRYSGFKLRLRVDKYKIRISSTNIQTVQDANMLFFF